MHRCAAPVAVPIYFCGISSHTSHGSHGKSHFNFTIFFLSFGWGEKKNNFRVLYADGEMTSKKRTRWSNLAIKCSLILCVCAIRKTADDIYRLISQYSSQHRQIHRFARQPSFIPHASSSSFLPLCPPLLFHVSHIPSILCLCSLQRGLIIFYHSSSIRPSSFPHSHTSSVPPPASSSSTSSCPRLFSALTLITPLRSSFEIKKLENDRFTNGICVLWPTAALHHQDHDFRINTNVNK